MTARSAILQRVTALLMLPLIVLHLVTIFYAVGDGLSATEILARTRGSLFWGLSYSAFVILASVHGALGLRVILIEWTSLRPSVARAVSLLIGFLILLLGLRAVAGVVMV